MMVDEGNSFKLFKRKSRLDVGRFKLANPVCEERNKMDEDVVAVGSVNAFMRKFDHHLRNVREGVLLSTWFSSADGHPW